MATEHCKQCGNSNTYMPMVGVMKVGQGESLEFAAGSRGDWVAWYMCAACHANPTIKAHFFPRENLDHALWGADKQIMSA